MPLPPHDDFGDDFEDFDPEDSNVIDVMDETCPHME